MKFCEYIKKARELVGLTQEGAASIIDVSVTTIQNWEKGQMPSGKENLNKIADAYKVNYEEFWSFYAEEMIPRKNVREKKEFPYFLFSDEQGKEIASLYLDVREQELLGLEFLYSQPNHISGQLDMDDKFSMECNLKSIQTNPMSYMPYQYIKEHGAFNTISLYNNMCKKLGKYKSIVIEYLIKHPDEIFDTTTIDSTELYKMFKPKLASLLNLLKAISENNGKKMIFCTNDSFGPTFDYDIVADYEIDEIIRCNDAKVRKLTREEHKIFREKLQEYFFIDETIIVSVDIKINNVAETYKSIKLDDWYGKYLTISCDKSSIFFSMSDEGKKLLEWYNTVGKDVVEIYPDIDKMIDEFIEKRSK